MNQRATNQRERNRALKQVLDRHCERRWQVESNMFGPYIVEAQCGRVATLADSAVTDGVTPDNTIAGIECGSRSGTAEDFERARLIAAAPELLAACRYVADFLAATGAEGVLRKRLLGAIELACASGYAEQSSATPHATPHANQTGDQR